MNIDDVVKQGGGVDVSRETIENPSNDFESTGGGVSFWKVPSIDKPIEAYLDHPLNKSHDEDLAQGLRGVDAFVGNTNLAIIDLLGLVKYLFKKMPRKAADNGEVQGEA